MDGPPKRRMLRNPGTQRIKPALAQLYEIGPLRLQKRTLKTVKAFVSRRLLRHNARELKRFCAEGVKLCAVVKANAYSHDARSVVTTLGDQYADWFAVSSLEEAEQIHPFAQNKPILITSPLFAGMKSEAVQLAQVRRFHCTVSSLKAVAYVSGLLAVDLPELNLHVKVDTGMGRVGCNLAEASMLAQAVGQNPKLHLAGVYTHFATADEADEHFTLRQIDGFESFLQRSGLGREAHLVKHSCNTAATLKFRQAHYDMVRCGIGLYGYTSLPLGLKLEADLRPVLRIEAPLVQVKSLPEGHSCGYGRSFIAPRDMKVGIIPIGYADGLFRCLSNKASLRVASYDVPIIGRISMDQTILDVSNVPHPAEGMPVTVIDNQPDSPCNADNLAKLAGTIPYEILTAIGNRVKRTLID